MNNFVKPVNYLLLLCATALAGSALATVPDRATQLRTKHTSLAEPLGQNQFKRPLVLNSAESPNRLTGDIYAVVDYPFDAVNTGLNNSDHWCDVLLLHINTKYCHAVTKSGDTTLNVNIGRKTPEKLADAARVAFDYSVGAASDQYFEITLNAKEGPMGTSNYRILLEAVAISPTQTFLHLTYSYVVNFAGRMAVQTYLGTLGSGKVGFSVTGKDANGQPDYIGGVRGLIERNTMRYYLAIDSFLGAAAVAPAAQPEKRLQDWFAATERYKRQLHEMDRETYLKMKRAEYIRQQTAH